MAVIHQVDGPITVQFRSSTTAGTGTYSTLGFCPNREPPQWSREWLTEEIGSAESGDEVEEAVHLGTRIVIQFTLAKWDSAELANLITRATPGLATTPTEGESGVIGSLWFGGGADPIAAFDLRFLSSLVGRTIREFPFCYFVGEGIREFEIGNTGTRLAFTVVKKRRIMPATSPAESQTHYIKSAAT